MKPQPLNDLENRMGHRFKNRGLLLTALTHSSYAHQHGVESYERLEFLGDAILGMIIAQELYKNRRFPEGICTKVRAALVCEDALAELSRELGINVYARLGDSAESAGERDRKSILADMFEAHIAALYLEAGLEETQRYVLGVYGDRIDKVISSKVFLDNDCKSRLQEKLQSKGGNVVYDVISEEGPVHDCLFTVAAVINGFCLGTGSAHSKKQAQQNAAQAALERIKAVEDSLSAEGRRADAHTILEELRKQ